jgi:hypothetical protein
MHGAQVRVEGLSAEWQGPSVGYGRRKKNVTHEQATEGPAEINTTTTNATATTTEREKPRRGRSVGKSGGVAYLIASSHALMSWEHYIIAT